ncbi:MAG: 30S ribosome-binding factor RbfA [Proteobacteria bacterium]|nr:30S ribosome-binding factor RbfA [Pseudomonadota bacterium]MBU1388300.1 30S ribosome-binding factor RbfA [Pseudomonadota bacterium]MBU1542883.1 30S ribosome-binding factor RbfA [Pseudomonadota bacterium]MBU2431177.1 30S ribosome-binding factor RbfA [Pseudomonadota bacterium]MBU2480802.1 30S ribosome-binding factor RbfA [Pseudomonadota bacterium]
MKPYARAQRVSVQIQTAITDLLSKKMQDPRIEMATISAVKLTSDLKIADIYVTVFGDKNKVSDVLKGFNSSKGFIKKSIAPRLGLRHMPELRFFYDDSFDNAARMDELIKSATSQSSETE